jgi:hypothetical protein
MTTIKNHFQSASEGGRSLLSSPDGIGFGLLEGWSLRSRFVNCSYVHGIVVEGGSLSPVC